MTPRAESDLERAEHLLALAHSAASVFEAECERWEAIARQLAEVLERHGSHPRLCLASDVCAVCAALSVYRDAIKEDK